MGTTLRSSRKASVFTSQEIVWVIPVLRAATPCTPLTNLFARWKGHVHAEPQKRQQMAPSSTGCFGQQPGIETASKGNRATSSTNFWITAAVIPGCLQNVNSSHAQISTLGYCIVACRSHSKRCKIAIFE